MDNITPEDVAKGIVNYMAEQNDCIIITRENFIKISLDVLREMINDESDKIPDTTIGMILALDRIRFVQRVEDKLFGKKEN